MRRSKGKKLLNMQGTMFVILVLIIVLQFIRIGSLTKRLKGFTILDWSEETIMVELGSSIKYPAILVTPEFVDRTFIHQSPFGDDHAYAELKQKYLKYGEFDLYGSGRRTGNIRRIHEGVDLYVPENTPVYPIYPIGIVTDVSNDPDFIFQSFGYSGRTRIDSIGVEYGKIVRILYPEGIESLYAHLNEVFVEQGQIVTGDTQVGLTGYTGNIRNSGKPSHLHIELRDVNGDSFDPEKRLHYQFASLRRFADTFNKQ
ncbi:MAG: M23 family metallopeptidase [Candidatus Cloacimonetes bacterium]|nr:M23 family metallopeptidase [Candidatus Cloacimonadota bacterium]